MSLVYYRGYTFMQDYMVNYLKYIFTAWERGQLDFFDGTKELDLSTTPDIIKRASWDFRNLPAILIGEASGGYKTISFTKDFIDEPDPSATNGWPGDTSAWRCGELATWVSAGAPVARGNTITKAVSFSSRS